MTRCAIISTPSDSCTLHRRALVAAAIMTLSAAAPSALAQWTVTNLHPAGMTTSQVNAISGPQQAGVATNAQNRACASLWSGTAASWVDLTPPGTIASAVNAIDGNVQAGYASSAGGAAHAGAWSGSPASWVDMHPAEASDSFINGASGGQFAGSVYSGGNPLAALRTSAAAPWVGLHQPAWQVSIANAISGNQQGGVVYIDDTAHASLWSGTPASWVDLHPPAAAGKSYVRAMDGGEQGGSTSSEIFGTHAALWRGTAASWIDLHPIGALDSRVTGVRGGVQVGWVTTSANQNRAILWNGTAASAVDLHAFLPATYTFSYANCVGLDGDTLCVGGQARNSLTGRSEAILWKLHRPPVITDHPLPVLTAPSANAVFNVGVTPGMFSATPNYQWRRNGTPLSTVANPTAATPVLRLTSVHDGNLGSYDCLVTNSYGGPGLVSNPATLSFTALPNACPADLGVPGGGFGHDGLLDNNDFISFITQFFEGC